LSKFECRDAILHFYQQKRLGDVGELEFRLPITKVDDCNIADVLFISQIYNVQPELNHHKEQMLRQFRQAPEPNLLYPQNKESESPSYKVTQKCTSLPPIFYSCFSVGDLQFVQQDFHCMSYWRNEYLIVVGRQSLFSKLQFVFIQVFFEFNKSHFFSFFRNLFLYFSEHFHCVKSFFLFSCRLHCLLFLLVNEYLIVCNHNVN
jgi:hypothetical protein